MRIKRWEQKSDAGNLSQELLLKAFRKLKGGQLTLPPSHTTKQYFHHENDLLPAESNPHIRQLPELFSDFYQPPVADFALIDASRIDVNFGEGSS
jgi:hypothetical protein